MLPLAGSQIPDSPTALAASLESGLNGHGITAREVRADGTFPAVEKIRLDLTGAKIPRDLRVPNAGAATGEQIHVADFTIVAAPLFFEGAPLQLDLNATEASMGFVRAASGELFLTLTNAANGAVHVAVERLDLEKLAHSLVSAAAAKQGIQIKQTRLELTQRGPRSIGFRAEVNAKMFIVSAKVAVTGNLDIDAQFNARLSGLACSGEGMIASAANALLKPHFHRIEGRSFPLPSLGLGDLQLRDLSIEAGETLHVRARFGSQM